jgi:hypothetical protein
VSPADTALAPPAVEAADASTWSPDTGSFSCPNQTGAQDVCHLYEAVVLPATCVDDLQTRARISCRHLIVAGDTKGGYRPGCALGDAKARRDHLA